MFEEYVPHDHRHDNFSERFLEQRIGILNGFTEPLRETSIPFPMRPVLSTPAITSQKRVSVTSIDSELAHFKLPHQPYLLHLNTYPNIHRKRRMNNRQLRL